MPTTSTTNIERFFRSCGDPNCEVAHFKEEMGPEFFSSTEAPWEDYLALLSQHSIIMLPEAYILEGRKEEAVHQFLGNNYPMPHVEFQVFERKADNRIWSNLYVACFSRDSHRDVYACLIGALAKQPLYLVKLRHSRVPNVLDRTRPELNIPLACQYSAETLQLLLDKSADLIEHIAFEKTRFSKAHCQVLGSFPGSLHFSNCSFDDDGKALSMEIADGEGPSELHIDGFPFDPPFLCHALQSSASSLLVLHLHPTENLGHPRHGDMQVGALFDAVGQNQSLTEFCFGTDDVPIPVTLKDWMGLFRGLRNHPSLLSLYLQVDFGQVPGGQDDARARTIAATCRARVVADMLKRNETLLELQVNKTTEQQDISEDDLDAGIIKNEILPRLKSNERRRRLLESARRETSGGCFALFNGVLANPVVRNDPSLVWAWLHAFEEELVAHLDEIGNMN